MLRIVQFVTRALEFLLSIPLRFAHVALSTFVFNPRLGPLRYVAIAGFAYVTLAVVLVYLVAPVRGYVGHHYEGENIRYAAERWLATAIYDRNQEFVGTFDPRLDSRRDVNYTGRPIELADTGYVANPDHKSIPVAETPEYYWRCLVYHEDRYLGTPLNPFGIDLFGVLKIPVSTITRSIKSGRPRMGVGGSTLPMQLARVIYKTPPRADESAVEKMRRKLLEWWDSPVIYWELTKGGDNEPFKKWAADHLWLAQRTGGQPLHGIEATSRIVFGKSAAELSIAEQFVLASAVNKPIILLEGSEKLNAVRLDRWRYIVDVRARKCAGELIADEATQKAIWFELTAIAGGPPDPQISPAMQTALSSVSTDYAKVAEANPALRANLLIPETRYGVREEMKQEYGFGWREYVRGVELTIDAAPNRAFRNTVVENLTELQKKYAERIDAEFTLDPTAKNSALGQHRQMPDIVIAAANEKGEIVRYFEAKDTAAYFGSELAHDRETGHYDRMMESRAIASVGKMISAIGIANEGKDQLDSVYVDDQAPSRGLESCRRGGNLRRGRSAEVSFACSLNRPLEWRTALLGQSNVRKLIDALGFNLPPAPDPSLATPPSTAVVLGMITGSPRTVHRMASVVLASLTGRGSEPVRYPTLVKSYDRATKAGDDPSRTDSTEDIVPDQIIQPAARARVRQFLSSPLCYEANGVRHGTMRALSDWCASRNPSIDLHFGKTGTHVGEDRDATVDVWAAGGIRFASGPAYSYVVMVGTGNSRRPWARKLHSSQIATPLLELLLKDLAENGQSETVRNGRSQPSQTAAATQ